MKKAAAIQMCSGLSVDENLKTAGKLIREAADQGAKLIVLPEMFPIVSSEKDNLAEKCGSGKIQDFLSQVSQENKIYLVAGTIPIIGENKMRAACLVYDDQGARVARYDKIHLFDVVLSEKEFYRESDHIEPGDQTVVIDTPLGKLGLAVCYDIRFPDLFMQLFEKGAEIIAIPAAFTEKTGEAHWELLARARAVENFSYIIGACQGGEHESGRKTYGHSVIINPWGKVVAEQKKPGPGIIFAEINLKELHEIRASIPVALHRKNIN